jgi:hypothetical protein
MKQIIALIIVAISLSACDYKPSSDEAQQAQQELILAEGTAQTGMPAIKNFRERKMLKDIIELRDQDGLTTYTYIVAEQTGKLVFICNSIGYGIPASTQYTSPQKDVRIGSGVHMSMPQADPNGLFSPSSAEGTWVLCADPEGGGKTRPVYIEPRVIVSPLKMQ